MVGVGVGVDVGVVIIVGVSLMIAVTPFVCPALLIWISSHRRLSSSGKCETRGRQRQSGWSQRV